MKTKLFLAATALLISATFISCDKSDTEKPVINLETPVNHTRIDKGGELCVEGELSDNEGIASYKINIHYGGDHDHAASGLLSRHDDGEEHFEFTETYEDALGQLNTTLHKHVDIDLDALAGEYHLMVYCTDTAGNESYVSRTIWIGSEADLADNEEYQDNKIE